MPAHWLSPNAMIDDIVVAAAGSLGRLAGKARVAVNDKADHRRPFR